MLVPWREQSGNAPKSIIWKIYKIANKAVWLGDVEAPDEAGAMEKAAAEYKVAASRLMALRRLAIPSFF
jgi:hypothetical protein